MSKKGISAVLAVAALVGLIALTGCTDQNNNIAGRIADRGLPQQDPAKVAFEFGDDHHLKSFDGEVGGGAASQINYRRTTREFYDTGQLKSETEAVASSDPTQPQNGWFDGLNRQSVTDSSHRINEANARLDRIERLLWSTIPGGVTAIGGAAIGVGQAGQAAFAETPEERAARLQREAERESIDKRLIDALERLAPVIEKLGDGG